VQYPTSVPEEGPGRWVTVAASEGKGDAISSAAAIFRGMDHPEDGNPVSLRIRSTAELDAEGGDALESALRSFAESAAIRSRPGTA
jgi:hypothetical protein